VIEGAQRGVVSERLLLAGIGAAQGVAFWILVEHWPEAPRTAAICVAVLTFLAVSATIWHFAWTGRDEGRLLRLAAGAGALFGAVGLWVGWQLPRPGEAFEGDAARGFTWIGASLACLYVLGPFFQIHQRTGRLRFPYPALFLHSWNNFFIGAVALAFVGALWAVLQLWAALFDLVKIDFFSDLFSERLFVYGVTGAAVGLGVTIGRESERVIETLRRVTLLAFRMLLPLVSFVSLLFLTTLGVTGLGPLWERERASAIVLAWLGIHGLFLNACWQDGTADPPSPRPLRWLVEAGVLCLPAYAGIALYGLGMRIAQHGLTPLRLWGLLLASLFALYAGGYAAAVLYRRGIWLAWLRPVNLVLALLAAGIALAAHTPLLDPLGWSARDQYRRLLQGLTPAADFDYGFLRFQLGRAGDRRLDALGTLGGHRELDAIREGIARARAAGSYWEWQQNREPRLRPEDLTTYPEGTSPPDGLFAALRSDTDPHEAERCRQSRACFLFSVELDGRPGDEWILRSGWGRLSAFTHDAGRGWRTLGRFQPAASEAIEEPVRAGRFETAPPLHPDLLIGEQRFRLSEPQPAEGD
jgi:hypothetical protein